MARHAFSRADQDHDGVLEWNNSEIREFVRVILEGLGKTDVLPKLPESFWYNLYRTADLDHNYQMDMGEAVNFAKMIAESIPWVQLGMPPLHSILATIVTAVPVSSPPGMGGGTRVSIVSPMMSQAVPLGTRPPAATTVTQPTPPQPMITPAAVVPGGTTVVMGAVGDMHGDHARHPMAVIAPEIPGTGSTGLMVPPGIVTGGGFQQRGSMSMSVVRGPSPSQHQRPSVGYASIQPGGLYRTG